MKKASLVFTLCILLMSTPAFNQDLEIYVSDAGNFSNPPWQILKFDANGQNPVVFINTNLNWPQDILFLEDTNQVLISNLGSGCINRHDATTGAFISSFACAIGGPTRMKIGPDSLLYVLQWTGNGTVRRYDLNGTYIGEFTSVGVPQSIGIDWDSAGNLYVSSYTGALVRKFDNAGNDLGVFINTNLAGPTNIWFVANGDLLVSDYNGTAVKRYNSTGTDVNDFMTGLSRSEGVDFFPNGDILIGNGATRSVKMYDSNGNYIKDFIATAAGGLLNPNAIVIRNADVNSTKEIIAQRKNILHPNIGNEFHINAVYAGTIASATVYDLSGSLVESFQMENTSKLTVKNLSEGLYFVSFRFNNGSFSTEKIMVQK